MASRYTIARSMVVTVPLFVVVWATMLNGAILFVAQLVFCVLLCVLTPITPTKRAFGFVFAKFPVFAALIPLAPIGAGMLSGTIKAPLYSTATAAVTFSVPAVSKAMVITVSAPNIIPAKICVSAFTPVMSEALGVTFEKIPCAEVTLIAEVEVAEMPTMTVFPDVVAPGSVRTKDVAVTDVPVFPETD